METSVNLSVQELYHEFYDAVFYHDKALEKMSMEITGLIFEYYSLSYKIYFVLIINLRSMIIIFLSSFFL